MNDEQKSILIGSDHAGYDYKCRLAARLEMLGYSITDVGTFSDASCDYPVPVHRLCTRIQSGEFSRGILICGTGIGVCIAANKHKGIRAATVSDVYSAEMTRKHNDANVLCLGARVIEFTRACEIADIFLNTEPLETGRHRRRVQMIEDLENGAFDEAKYVE